VRRFSKATFICYHMFFSLSTLFLFFLNVVLWSCCCKLKCDSFNNITSLTSSYQLYNHAVLHCQNNLNKQNFIILLKYALFVIFLGNDISF